MPSTEPYTQEQIDDALTALIAYAGNGNAASKYLRSQGKRAPGSGTLLSWARTVHWERYEELREKFAQKREETLANNYLDAAASATEGVMLAVEVAKERLEKRKDQDPARTAANLATVAAKSTDKRLSLQGRPTQITESRDVEQIMRSLVAKVPQIFNLTEAVEEPKELTE